MDYIIYNVIMPKIAFIVDSSGNVHNGQYPDVYVLPLIVNVKDQHGNLTMYKDGETINSHQICQFVEDQQYSVSTSQASMGEMINLIESIYDKYDRIYVLPILSKISGSYNTWMQLVDDYPKLMVYPQTDICIGINWTIEHLIDLKNQNKLNDDTFLEYVTNIHHKRHIFLYVYSLAQLAKGGRVSNFKSKLANLLGLKIIITVGKDGLNFYKTAKSCDKLWELSLEECKEREPSFDISNVARVAFVHSPIEKNDKNEKEYFEIVQNKLSNNSYKLEHTVLSAVILAHTGAKCFAIYMEGNK